MVTRALRLLLIGASILVPQLFFAAGIRAADSASRLIAKMGGNTLVIEKSAGKASCEYFEVACVRVMVNKEVVEIGIGDSYDINGTYPTTSKSEIVIVTTETGGNAVVSSTRIVDLGARPSFSKSFATNFTGNIRIQKRNDNQFNLVGRFREDELGDLVDTTVIYDRQRKLVFYEPKPGVLDYSSYIDRHPFELFEDKRARRDILRVLGSQSFRELRDRLTVADEFAGGSDFDAIDWLVSTGWMAHSAPEKAVLAINVQTGLFIALISEERNGIPFFSLWSTYNSNQIYTYPYGLQEWLQKLGAGLDVSGGGLKIRNSVNPQNDGVSHLSQNPSDQQNTPPAKPDGEVQESGTGTGFKVSNDDHVLTNYHVVGRCQKILLRKPDEPPVDAELVASDATNDLALVKAQQYLSGTVATFSTGPAPRAGSDIAVYGFPLAGALSTSGNIVTGNITALAGLGNDSRLFQISAPVQPGNSGGPVMDTRGSVIAVVVSKLNAIETAKITGDIPQNVNFAIKANVATNFLEGVGINFPKGNPADTLDTPTIAERAQAFTYLVECQN